MKHDPREKLRFYYKIETTKEDEQVEIYLGQSCGKQLQREIENAQNEVLIVSPYIDKSKVNSLIRINRNRVNVRLAFSYIRNENNENRKDSKAEILQRLIIQTQLVDEQKVSYKKKKQFQYKIIRIIAFVIFLASCTFAIYYTTAPYQLLKQAICISVLGGLLFVTNWYISKKTRKVRQLPVFSYQYHMNIPFKCFYHGNEKFIHSKIYIIDRKVAYLGSMNFTEKGFSSNFETSIRITEKQQVEELHSFVTNIFDNDDDFPSVYPNVLIRDAGFYQPPY